jgi:hypothetical protein
MRRSPLALALFLLAASTAAGQEAYFAPFDDCEARAMAVLDTATRTVDVAQYNIRSERFVTKLEELRARGVAIRITVDAKNAEKDYNTVDDLIESKGFDLVRSLNDRAAFAIMHHKFTIIDDTTVMTGSYNWNETAQEVNDENMLVFRDPALAAAYKAEFEELRGAPEVSQPGQGNGVTVYFSPDDRARDAIVEQMRLARESIMVCMFTFKDDVVARAMRDAARRGVKVLLVAEKKQADTTRADETVASGGPNARVIIAANTSSPFSAMHHKFAVIDGRRVITGACNWTYTAFNYSDEDTLVIASESLARQYTAGLGDVVARYAPESFDPVAFGIDRPDVRAHFVVTCDSTTFGERVVIVGGHPALGDWDPSRGIPLNTNESLFPTWAGRTVLPRGERIEWKAVIVGPSGPRWEEGDNRVMETSPLGAGGAWIVRFRDGSENAPADATPADASTPATPNSGLTGGLPGN